MIPIRWKMSENKKEATSLVKLKMLKNKDFILSFFNNVSKNFLNKKEITEIYHKCIDNKFIYSTTTFRMFENFLIENDAYKQKVILDFPNKKYVRFFVNEPTLYEIVQSINSNGYLSHYSAVAFHNLTNNIPKTIFFNVEKPKPTSEVPKKQITQEELNKAFYMPPRESVNLFVLGIYSINLLQGKYTNNLGVTEQEIDGQRINVAGIERTLIDIAVSPYYCGGCYEVFNVFKNAKNDVDIKKLVKMLKTLDYIYPVNQSIGFYLEKAGYPEKDLKLFEEMGTNLRFFVQRELRDQDRNFSERWNLYYPKFL